MTPHRTRASILRIAREECDAAHDMAGRLDNRLARATGQLTAAHIWYRILTRVEREVGVTLPPREPVLLADVDVEDPGSSRS